MTACRPSPLPPRTIGRQLALTRGLPVQQSTTPIGSHTAKNKSSLQNGTTPTEPRARWANLPLEIQIFHVSALGGVSIITKCIPMYISIRMSGIQGLTWSCSLWLGLSVTTQYCNMQLRTILPEQQSYKMFERTPFTRRMHHYDWPIKHPLISMD